MDIIQTNKINEKYFLKSYFSEWDFSFLAQILYDIPDNKLGNLMKKDITKPAKPDHKGVMRNDLPGYMKLKGNRIYIRYKGKDISIVDNAI